MFEDPKVQFNSETSGQTEEHLYAIAMAPPGRKVVNDKLYYHICGCKLSFVFKILYLDTNNFFNTLRSSSSNQSVGTMET